MTKGQQARSKRITGLPLLAWSWPLEFFGGSAARLSIRWRKAFRCRAARCLAWQLCSCLIESFRRNVVCAGQWPEMCGRAFQAPAALQFDAVAVDCVQLHAAR
ncbi:hypothetical protein P4054_29120 [Pseudomonas aeruginosa]|nr:hypothetical protein [Pseudomonas aeruginosa]